MKGTVGFLVVLLCATAAFASLFTNNERALEDGVVTCSICRTVMEEALGWINAGDSRDELVEKFTAACVAISIPEEVCRGVTELNIDVVLFILIERNQTDVPLTPREVCGFALYPECNLEGYDWSLDLDFLGPKPTPEDPQLPPNGSPTMKILQITDVHVDPMYLPGGNAVCGMPMCCRSDQGEPANASDAAGYWGDYRNCDLPQHTFENLLEHAAVNNPDISYVMFTGDIIDHGVWETSNQYNIDLITLVINLIGSHFPGVPVLPIFGNHEANPTNVFSPNLPEIPANLSTTWMYEFAADLWGQWLPANTRDTILQGGFYTMEIQPGLQVIVMNSMFCYHYNWWLMYENVDPSGELIWMAQILQAAEADNKKVHILMHHPSGGSDCMHTWAREYRRIIDRFESTVVAQFHGHTHNDHFSIYYDLADPNRATNVAYTAGSGTSYSDVNMNYRLYTVDGSYDGSTFQILDHETWYFNLTEANLAGAGVDPVWQKLYSFNEAYGTASMLPAEMDALVQRMINDVQLQDQYFRYYVKLGDPELEAGCDAECSRELMCKILTTVTGDDSKCVQLLP